MTRRLPWVALGILIGSLVWSALRHHERPSAVAGAAMPALRVNDMSGNPVTLSDWADHVTVVNVWASWCGPCVQEMPSLQRLHERLGPEGLRVVGISADDTLGEARAFVSGAHVAFPQFHDPGGASIFGPLDVEGLPTTLVVGRDGRIVDVYAGIAQYDAPAALDHFRGLLRR